MNERTKYCKRRKAGRLNLVAYVISSRRCVCLASKMQSTSRVPSALLWPVTFHIASPKRARERRRESGSGRREERSRHYSSVTACAKRDAGIPCYLCISPLSTAKGNSFFSHTTSSNHFMLSHCPPQSPFCCDIPCCGPP